MPFCSLWQRYPIIVNQRLADPPLLQARVVNANKAYSSPFSLYRHRSNPLCGGSHQLNVQCLTRCFKATKYCLTVTGRLPIVAPRCCRARQYGEVSERLKEHAWKVCIRENVSRVRIPPSPPYSIRKPERKFRLFCMQKSPRGRVRTLVRVRQNGNAVLHGRQATRRARRAAPP